uniref:Uncharacterized protein n=1 Tax=Tanacetum cinerariifolium TaxID=118510 RepID=A0A699J0D7_TANCI|nr:hypothetical protein [Tanacetum cinerariifolium]
MRLEQYFLMTDYSLWEVILNGDSPVPTRVVEGVVQQVGYTSTEQKLARRNELKARAVNMSLTDINASLTKHNLHQQCKLFSKGNSSTQQWEHFFTSSGKITLAVEI